MLTFMDHKDMYYLDSAMVEYSENAFPNGEGADTKTIMATGLNSYSTKKVSKKSFWDDFVV